MIFFVFAKILGMPSQQASCTRLCNGLQRSIAGMSALACGNSIEVQPGDRRAPLIAL
jgi:hypothetical protein